MTAYVVDASVAVKWFFPEDHSGACAKLLSRDNQLLAPDLVWSEVGNVVWKRFRRNEITVEEATQVVTDLVRMPLETVTTQDFLTSATEIAVSTGITVYDAIYLSLAIARNCQLVTADEKLMNRLADTIYKLTLVDVSTLS